MDFNEVTLVVARDKYIMDRSLWRSFKVAVLLSGFQYTGRADAHNRKIRGTKLDDLQEKCFVTWKEPLVSHLARMQSNL